MNPRKITRRLNRIHRKVKEDSVLFVPYELYYAIIKSSESGVAFYSKVFGGSLYRWKTKYGVPFIYLEAERLWLYQEFKENGLCK